MMKGFTVAAVLALIAQTAVLAADLITAQEATNIAEHVVATSTNASRSVDGAARTLPMYLWRYDADDSYPAEAEEYYRSRGDGRADGGCSSVRRDGFLYRNFDFPFDDRAEFVVRMSAGPGRFASIGVAQVGTNLTERFVTSGKPSRCYNWLPGATVDGINEYGVACNVNVVGGEPSWGGGASPALHPLAAIRWILDNATNAQHAAEYIASHIAFPAGWRQNYHYMVCDAERTYIVENGEAHDVTDGAKVLTNFRLYPSRDTTGEGQERYDNLADGESITSQWWTITYTQDGYRASDLPGVTGRRLADLFGYWRGNTRESHRGESFGGTNWWQTVHTSVYDLSSRTLRICVQENPEWYVFRVPASGSGGSGGWVNPEDVRTIVRPMISSATNGLRRVEDMAVYDVVRTENTDWTWTSESKELEATLNDATAKPTFRADIGASGAWVLVDPSEFGRFLNNGAGLDSRDTTETTLGFVDIGTSEDPVEYHATARRPRYIDERFTPSTNSVLAAVVTNGAGAVTSGDIVKVGSDGRLVKATAGADYIKDHQDISGKRDSDDNTCHKTEPGKWVSSELPSELAGTQPVYDGVGFYGWIWLSTKTGNAWSLYGKDKDFVGTAEFTSQSGLSDFTATRSAVCTDGKRFVTEDVVDGKVSAAVSTNNPAFVSAVRNTPTSGMPEDVPTDWGTYGTVGAALAALAAGLKWMKGILGSLASGYETFSAWIASKYTKPSDGIPATDLDQDVQNSLDAADAAAPQATTYTKDETDELLAVKPDVDLRALKLTLADLGYVLLLPVRYDNLPPYDNDYEWYCESDNATFVGSFTLTPTDPYDPYTKAKLVINGTLQGSIQIDQDILAGETLTLMDLVSATSYPIEFTFDLQGVGQITARISPWDYHSAYTKNISWLQKNVLGKISQLGDDGKPTDTFALDLLQRQALEIAPEIFVLGNDRANWNGKADASDLPIPIVSKTGSFTTESYKRFVVNTMPSGGIILTLHAPTGSNADVFECRFNGGSLSADASVTFTGATATTMDTNCGTVTAGKVALMSAFWNGTTWDVNWKVKG